MRYVPHGLRFSKKDQNVSHVKAIRATAQVVKIVFVHRNKSSFSKQRMRVLALKAARRPWKIPGMLLKIVQNWRAYRLMVKVRRNWRRYLIKFRAVYSLQFVDQLHLVDWEKKLRKSGAISPMIRLHLEHGTFMYEEIMIRARQAARGLFLNPVETFAHYPLKEFIPLFFRNGRVAELVLSGLRQAGLVADVPLASKELSLKTNMKVLHAYWYLMHLSYHAGQGYLCGKLHEPMKKTQQLLLLPHLPKPSPDLKARLKDAGIDSLEEVRLLSPDWTANIGHTGHLNVHLKMGEMGWWPEKPVLVTYPYRVANGFFLKLLEKRCPTFILGQNTPAPIWHELASLIPFLEGPWHTIKIPSGESMYWNDAGARGLAEWDAQNRGYPMREAFDAHIAQDAAMMARFEKFRRDHGMLPSDWYVCLHMRDSQARGDVEGKGESVRNTEIGNYLDTVRLITESGGWVIRMGGSKAPKFPPMERVIDYAHYPEKSPEMDIHLVRSARMFIGTTSGFAYVASAFGVPTVMVNSISSLGLLWSKNTRFALKHIYKADGKMLSIKEFTSEQYRWAYPTHEAIERAGLTVRDNAADEILETAREVLDLANGRTRDEDFNPAWQASVSTPHFFGSAKPSQYFLEKYPHMLDA